MPSSQSLVLCTCKPCREQSLHTGVKGKLVSKTELNAHIARSRASTLRRVSIPVSKPSNPPHHVPDSAPPISSGSSVDLSDSADTNSSESLDEIDRVATEIFSLTLNDDGIDPTHHPDKLWTSRAEFQDSNLPSSPSLNPPSLTAVIEGVQRLSIQAHPNSRSAPPSTPPRPSRSTSSPRRTTPVRRVNPPSPPHHFTPPRPSHNEGSTEIAK